MKIHPSLKNANIPLLIKVRDAILTEPRKFDMSTYFSMSEKSPCGTTACIAGHTLAIKGRWNKLNQGVKKYGVGAYLLTVNDAAEKALGLTRNQSYAIFGLVYWPAKFSSKHRRSRTPLARAKVAARRISHFIRTGE